MVCTIHLDLYYLQRFPLSSTGMNGSLYTTLPHNLIKENGLIALTFRREGSVYLAYNGRNVVFFTSEKHKNYTLLSCQKVCEAFTFLLDNII